MTTPDPVAEIPPKCCKCDAYREINQAQAQHIMRMLKAFDEIRDWMPTLARYCKEGEGK